MRIPIDIAPGLVTQDTSFRNQGRWEDASNVRFRDGQWEVIGGWESLVTTLLTGVCRTIFQWTDNSSALNIAFGTNEKLQLWIGGVLYDITPTLAKPGFALIDAGVTVTNGTALMTVVKTAHGLTTGDSVVVSGGVGVGRLVPSGAYTATVTDANTFTITAGSNAQLSKTLGSNPLSVTSGSPTVTVTETGHNISSGTSITVSGASAVGGITPNGTFVATRIDANSYKFNFTSGATSTATGGGASVAVAVPATGGIGMTFGPQNAFAAGAIDGTGGAGYGTGAYSVGGYSEPSTADFFPRTWALAAWGQQLIANPRGGTLYSWANVTADKAAPLTNAPAEVTYMLVVPQRQVMALGCNEETSGTFNPLCIRWSDIEDPEQWATATNNNAGEYILEGGSRIVCGRVVGDYVFIWTDVALYMGTFIGDPGETWRFEKLGNHCGAIGPNAPVIYSQQAFWIAPDTQFWTCQLGGAPQSIDCPVWKEFSDNIAVGQNDKIVGATISKFREVRWFYPDQRDGYENSRDITLNLAGPWCHGRLPRTAFVDAGPSDSPIGVTSGGNTYWHERGNSADGAAFSWFIRSSDFYIGEGDKMLMIRGIWPDFKGQIGPMNFEINTRMYPQAAARLKGPYTLAPNQSKKDFRATGRVANVRFYGSSAPTYARMGKPEFDATDVGEN